MSNETTSVEVETWAADGDNLTRDGEIVGSLSTPELAEWVAEACEVFAEMEAAQAVWAASDEAPNCSMVEIGGEEMRVQGSADWTDQDRREMGQIVSAARQRMAEEKAAEHAEIEREVRAQVAKEYEDHLLMLASGFEEIAYDGGMPGATKTGAGSPRALKADIQMLRELAKDTSWITGGDR